MPTKPITLLFLSLMSTSSFADPSVAVSPPPEPFAYVPATVSEQARRFLQASVDPKHNPTLPASRKGKAWRSVQQGAEAFALERQQTVLNRLQPQIQHTTMGDVPVIEVRPKNYRDDGRVLVFTHGGGYVVFSAASTLDSAAMMADATGMKVLSIDYTLAPFSQWQNTTDQVVAVFKALYAQGVDPAQIAMYGDSAGGALAAGSVLKLRDLKLPMPSALVLWSPWSDIRNHGDTYETLKHAEPTYLYDLHLAPAAKVYAEEKDFTHPYVSPVYGDYTRAYPPVLIQGGTKEIFLSNFVRHYQALDSAGKTVKLDLYEGMPHVFQVQIPDAPETALALKKAADFIRRHMRD